MQREPAHYIGVSLLLVLAVAPVRVGAHAEPHERIAALTLALTRNPCDAVLWFERAAEYLDYGDAAAALRDLDRVESLDPGRAEVPIVRGTTR